MSEKVEKTMKTDKGGGETNHNQSTWDKDKKGEFIKR